MIFKQAFRVAFVALVWKQYKATIVSTLLLVAFLFIVSNIHQDYLAATGPDNVNTLSFIYKWAAYVAGFVLYFGFHILRGRLKSSNADTKGNLKTSFKDKISESKDLTDTSNDPFAEIRARKKLRSRADFVINEGKDDK